MKLTSTQMVFVLVLSLALMVSGGVIGNAYARYQLKEMIQTTLKDAIRDNPTVDIDEMTTKVLQDVTEFMDGH